MTLFKNYLETEIEALQSGTSEEGYWESAIEQVLMDSVFHTITNLTVVNAAPAVGTGMVYATPTLTFIGAGVRTVVFFGGTAIGEDAGIPSIGIGSRIVLQSSGNFSDPSVALVGSSGLLIGMQTIRRHFDDGETLTPKASLQGDDETKHGGFDCTLWVTA